MASIIQSIAGSDLTLQAATGRTVNFVSDADGTVPLSGMATKAFVASTIATLVNSAPGVLDTLGEIATALDGDSNFAETISLALADKANSADVYTSTEVDTALADKANSADVYTSAEVDTIVDDLSSLNIINEDNTPKLFIGQERKAWTKGVAGFTGALAIEITGLYEQAAMNGMMNVHILEVGSTKIAKTINISGQWNNSSSQWDYGWATDYTGNETLNVRFARDVTNSKVYVLIGDLSKVWPNTRVSINIPISSYATGLNLGFNISGLSDFTGITVDIIKELNTFQTSFVPAPTSSIGADGDTIGQIAISASHVYYCTATYTDGLSDIWARTPLTLETW